MIKYKRWMVGYHKETKTHYADFKLLWYFNSKADALEAQKLTPKTAGGYDVVIYRMETIKGRNNG